VEGEDLAIRYDGSVTCSAFDRHGNACQARRRHAQAPLILRLNQWAKDAGAAEQPGRPFARAYLWPVNKRYYGGQGGMYALMLAMLVAAMGNDEIIAKLYAEYHDSPDGFDARARHADEAWAECGSMAERADGVR
jgi:hypothetical protein